MKRSIFTAFALIASAACLTAEIRIGTVDAIKAATNKVQPQYPAVARQMKIAGHVEIEALIDTNGSVTSVRAISGNPMLTQPQLLQSRTGNLRLSPATARLRRPS